MSAVTWEERPNITLTATSRPDSAPLMIAVSASTEPLTEPPSPMVILPAVRLPKSEPADMDFARANDIALDAEAFAQNRRREAALGAAATVICH